MCGHGILISCTCAFKAIASWYCCLIFQVIFTKVINKKFGVRSNILSVHMYSHQLNTGSHLSALWYSCILTRHLYQDRQYGTHLLHTILPLIMPCHVSYSGLRAVQCSLYYSHLKMDALQNLSNITDIKTKQTVKVQFHGVVQVYAVDGCRCTCNTKRLTTLATTKW